jgi:hypothetical protein
MANAWYYLKDKKTLGPVGATELKRLASDGTLLPSDLIRKDGMKDWARASSAKGLFDTATSPQPVSPPAPDSVTPPLASETAAPVSFTWNDQLLNGARQLCDEWSERAGGARLPLKMMSRYIAWTQAICGARLPDGSKERPTKGLYTFGMFLLLFFAYGIAAHSYKGIAHDTKTSYSEDFQYVQEGNRINLNQIERKVRMHETTTERKMNSAEQFGGYVLSAILAGAACWCLLKMVTFDRASRGDR